MECGEKEARLIALACSQPEGRAKWTLRLLETKVVELNIVDHASDNTIGRVLKKMSSSLISCSNGSSRRKQQRIRSGDGGCSGCLQAATRRRWSAGLSGRDVKTTACRYTGTDPDEARTTGAMRLRIRTQRHGQSVHDVRPARRLAARQRHRSTHRCGLRPGARGPTGVELAATTDALPR